MKIRIGTYTMIDGIEMKISKCRYEVPIPEEEKKYSICYSVGLGAKEGFVLNKYPLPYESEYCKEVYLTDITNAFAVITKAKYNGKIFDVEPFEGDDVHLHLATRDMELGKRMNFYKLHDGHGNPYYLAEVKLTNIENIWEERGPTIYNIPMPDGIEAVKHLWSK